MAVSGDVGGARAHGEHHGREPARDEPGVRERAQTDRHVQPFLDEIADGSTPRSGAAAAKLPRRTTSLRFDQLALQTWRGEGADARITHERFVFDPTTVAPVPGAP